MSQPHIAAKWSELNAFTRSAEYEAWGNLVKMSGGFGGLYAVWRGKELLYIGRSYRIRNRLMSHHNWPTFYEAGADSITWIQVDDEFVRASMEQMLIRMWKPIYNKRGKK